jgi:hypothetical protein
MANPQAELVRHIAGYVQQRYGPHPQQRVAPAVLRLHMHPQLHNWLRQSQWLYQRAAFGTDPIEQVTGLPVRQDESLDPGQWQVMLIHEQVVTGGTVNAHA